MSKIASVLTDHFLLAACHSVLGEPTFLTSRGYFGSKFDIIMAGIARAVTCHILSLAAAIAKEQSHFFLEGSRVHIPCPYIHYLQFSTALISCTSLIRGSYWLRWGVRSWLVFDHKIWLGWLWNKCEKISWFADDIGGDSMKIFTPESERHWNEKYRVAPEGCSQTFPR